MAITGSYTLWCITLITLVTVISGDVSISHFACNDTWNPAVDCNTKITVNELCKLELRLTNLVSESLNGTTTPIPSNNKPSRAQLQLIVTSGSETLRATSIHGVDYSTVGSKEITLSNNGETDVQLSDITITLPNMCGQTYLIVRIIVANGDTVELSIPIQLKCPETNVDLALVGSVQEEYDIYTHRPVLHTTGQALTHYIPNFQLYVRNVLNTSFSSRTGPSAYTVSAYIKPQLWYMYQWSVGNNSWATPLNVEAPLLEYQLGDVLLTEGNQLVPTDKGRRTAALPGGSQTELRMDKLVLKSKEVCGNGIMVVQLKVQNLPNEFNKTNNFYILPVFIDCWGHNPVETVETCQVIPNYYDGGQTAWITYTVPGQTKVFEYKSEERSVRTLNPDVDTPTMQDIALMKLTTDIQSNRLMELGQCVDTMWGSSDTFVTSTDVLLTSLRKYWDDVQPKGEIQKKEHSKISLMLNTGSDMLTLALQPQNPLHDWLHVLFQYFFNPLLPYDSNGGSNRFEETNQVSRRKRSIDDNNLQDNEVDQFEAAAAKRDASSDTATTKSTARAARTTRSNFSKGTESPASGSATTKSSAGSRRGATEKSAAGDSTTTSSGRTTKAGRTTDAPAAAAGQTSTVSSGRTTKAGRTTDAPAAATGQTSTSSSGSTTKAGRGTASPAAAGQAATSSSAGTSSRTSAQTTTKAGRNAGTTHAGGAGGAARAGGSSAIPTTVIPGSSTTGTRGRGTSAAAAATTASSAMGSTTGGSRGGRDAKSTDATATQATTSKSAGTTNGKATTVKGAATTSSGSKSTATGTTKNSASGKSTVAPIEGTKTTSSSGSTTKSAEKGTTGGQTGTSGPSTTTAKSTGTTVKSTGTTIKSTGTTTKSTGTTVKSTGTTVKSTGTTVKSMGTTGKSTGTTGKSTGTTGKSTGTTSQGSYSDKTDDAKHFGPKPKWHEQVMEHLYEMVKYNGKGMYILSPQRWQAISLFLKTLLYGHKEDFERYSYIPKATQDGLVSLMKLAIGQNLPRIFDNLPGPIMKAVDEWMNLKYQRRVELGSSACDFQEGFELALNVTEDLLMQKQWADRSDQLVMLAHVFRIVLKDDHTQYLSELYTRLTAATKMGRTWMIRDGVPIHEPDMKDVCQRYTAVKLWQLRTFPVFQFAGRTVSPDQYQSVFWTQDKGTILRGDRSELTGQVFWTKVATCSCPAGNACSANVALAQNGVNPMMAQTPTGQPMAAAAMHKVQIDEGIDLTNDDDDTDRHDGYAGLYEAEDMMFGE